MTGRAHFPKTRWSVVLASGTEEPVARRAFEELCRLYWYPLYAYARRRGLEHSPAEDIVQGFFLQLLANKSLRGDRVQGRFRSYLRGAFANYWANARRHEQALKRGGGRILLDAEVGERAFAADTESDPERCFERAWARTLVGHAKGSLRGEYEARDRLALFEALAPRLMDEGASDEKLQDIARRLAMTEGGVKVALHRLRVRFGRALRAQIIETVATPKDADAELETLIRSLGPG